MDAKSHYQKYWKSKCVKEEFVNYERNWVLPNFFREKQKVLDVGCGDGVVSEFLQKNLGMDVVGFDISEKAAAIARKRGLRVVVGDVEKKFPFKNQDFDAVFWGDNVEHLFDPEYTLKEIRRILRPGGRLVLSCPNMGYWRYRLYYFLNGSLPDTEWTGNPPWAWSHIRFYNTERIGAFLQSQKFKVINIVGVNRRKIDSSLVKIAPSLFGMVLVVESVKI